MKHTNVRILSFSIVVAAINILKIINPQVAMEAARRGALLWFNNVLPGILPFVIGANVLMNLGVVKFLGIFLSPATRFLFKLPGSASFAIGMGAISGYPMGAKIVCQLRASGELTKNEAQRLLAFSNNAGPLFVLGAVAVGMFGSVYLGYLLLIGHYIGAISLGLLTRLFARKSLLKSDKLPVLVVNKEPFGQVLGQAVKNSMETLLIIGGFIILFSVVSALVTQFSFIGSYVSIFLASVLEMTGGLGLLAEEELAQNIAAAAGAVLGFGGFSVMFQALSFIGKTDLSPTLYILSKLAHGILAGIATFLIYPIFSNQIQTATVTTFAPSIVRTFANSTVFFIIATLALIALGAIALIAHKIKTKQK